MNGSQVGSGRRHSQDCRYDAEDFRMVRGKGGVETGTRVETGTKTKKEKTKKDRYIYPGYVPVLFSRLFSRSFFYGRDTRIANRSVHWIPEATVFRFVQSITLNGWTLRDLASAKISLETR